MAGDIRQDGRAAQDSTSGLFAVVVCACVVIACALAYTALDAGGGLGALGFKLVLLLAAAGTGVVAVGFMIALVIRAASGRGGWTPVCIAAATGVATLAGFAAMEHAREAPNSLVAAAAEGDIARIKQSLWWGADINAPCHYYLGFSGAGSPPVAGETALTAASSHAVIIFLLDHGAWPDQPDGKGKTPLKKAAESINPDNVALLVERGAKADADMLDAVAEKLDVGAGREAGQRLDAAVKTARLLVSAGADIASPQAHLAAMRKNTPPDFARALARLRREQPTQTTTSSDGLRCDFLNHVALGEDAEALALLRDHADFVVGGTLVPLDAIRFAARFGNARLLAFLLDDARFARANSEADAPDKALLAACGAGRADIAAMLLDRGISVAGAGGKHVDALDDPLTVAAYFGRDDVARLLLSRGADPNAPADTTPPIGWAAENNHFSMIRLLYDAGADLAPAREVAQKLSGWGTPSDKLEKALRSLPDRATTRPR